MTVRYTALVFVVLIVAGAVVVRVVDSGGKSHGSHAAVRPTARAPQPKPKPRPAYATAPARLRLHPRFKDPPRSGMLFDLRSGRVLWSRRPYHRQPIASLAKMMTAIVVADHAASNERVYISDRAKAEPGSAVGLLPPHRRVRLLPLMYGLMLPSGNDAAIALAEHVGHGSVGRFVRRMNRQARRLGLHCSHFSSPDGYVDRGNTSCARDLAVLAREVLKRPRLARIVRTEYVVFPFLEPHTAKVHGHKKTVWKPGHLYLAGHNPLLRDDYPGATGIKTGYTDAAGRCLVATARRHGHSLGVVLLASPDPGGQAERLLDRAFRRLSRHTARHRRAVSRRRGPQPL